jgi:hypothetical protein
MDTKDRILYLSEEHKDEVLLQEEIEFLTESIRGKLNRLQTKVLKIRVKAKRSLKKGKITLEEYNKIKEFCEDVEKDILLFGNADKLQGYSKSMVKRKVNDLLYKVNKVLNNNVFVEILKKAGCFGVFFALLKFVIFALLPGTFSTIGGLVGAGLLTELVKRIIRKAREIYTRFDGTVDRFAELVDTANDQFRDREIGEVSTKF